MFVAGSYTWVPSQFFLFAFFLFSFFIITYLCFHISLIVPGKAIIFYFFGAGCFGCAFFFVFLVEATGFAPLAARPSGRLSIVQFCHHLFVSQRFEAKQLFSRKVLPTLEPRRKPRKQKNPKMETPFLDFWSRRRGSNPRPQRPERCALPAALRLVLSFKRTYYNKCAFNCQSFLCG